MNILNKHFLRGMATVLYLLLAFATSASEASSFSDKIRSFYSDARAEFFKQERELYENSEPSAGLYNVYVFEQVIPIPKRFVLLTQGEKGYQFNSMPDPDGLSVEGVIKVGSYAEIENDLENRRDSTKDAYIDKRTGFKIAVFEKEIVAPDGSGQITMEEAIISDGNQYMSIFDDNPMLWELILDQLKPK